MTSSEANVVVADVPRKATPSPFERFVVAPFRAGLLGAGVAAWALGILVTLHRHKLLFRPTEDQAIALAFLAAAAAAMGAGFVEPVRSYAAIVGRFIGSLIAGVILEIAVVAALKRFDAWSVMETMRVWSLAGLVLATIAIAWIRGRSLVTRLRASLRARVFAAVAVAALALATLWPLSPGVRCSLGSATGCRRGALIAVEAEDDAGTASFARRGCELGDAISCRIAGDGYWGGYGLADPHDRIGAEPFYRQACALGDARGCELVHLLELHAGCEANRASACHELADVYRSRRDPASAARFATVACLLGDDAACAPGVR